MPRHELALAATWRNLKWAVQFHKRPFWLVPTEDGYEASPWKPDPACLPHGTTAKLYDPELTVIDSMDSTNPGETVVVEESTVEFEPAIDILRRAATGEIVHLNQGLCPDRLDHHSRDPDCDVCKAIIAVDLRHTS